MAGIWTAERRAAQAARARAAKPWTKSTGPKSTTGKAMVARNALKTGLYARDFRAEIRHARAVLRCGRQLLAEYRELCHPEAKTAKAAKKSKNKVKPPVETTAAPTADWRRADEKWKTK